MKRENWLNILRIRDKMRDKKLDPKNESHWMTHAEHEERRGKLTQHGAPKPDPMSPLWNDWCANNPQPEAKALAVFDPSEKLMQALKGIARGARPIEKD
tara:strand:+ start:4669 stop:4965 length:297 start_codon:yes stop_codon:yes gene_type:complete